MRNILITHPDDPACRGADAALVWELYDDDWTDEQAVEHLDSILAWCPLVLLRTTRRDIRDAYFDSRQEHGEYWTLVQGRR